MTTIEERKKMLLAMEYICRQINDEEICMHWLIMGVPDGDVEYGNFDMSQIDDNDNMLEDKNFEELMRCFLQCIQMSIKDGGLFCGGVVAEVDE